MRISTFYLIIPLGGILIIYQFNEAYDFRRLLTASSILTGGISSRIFFQMMTGNNYRPFTRLSNHSMNLHSISKDGLKMALTELFGRPF
jgi:hypothetical protein